jgi:hypothetical protein
MADIPQSHDDLKEHLSDSIHFLEVSSDSYDGGYENESKRLAVTIRTLVHDTPRSVSLLKQLELKQSLFLDTSHPNLPGNVLTYSGLIAMYLPPGKTPRYVPKLDSERAAKLIPFDAWWNGIIFIDIRGQAISRRELILSHADKDGGAHVDPALDEKYGELSRQNSMGWIVSGGSQQDSALRAPERASVRQIAHEVLKTLKPGYEKKMPPFEGAVFSAVAHSPYILPPGPQDEVARGTFGAHCHCGSGHKYKKCHGRLLSEKKKAVESPLRDRKS